jgi:molybdenum cofactor synthesis domain-containing protein
MTEGERMATLRVAVIVVSDRAASGERPDATGPRLRDMLQSRDAQVTEIQVVPDEQQRIADVLLELCGRADVVLTAGGTGLAARDVTPEATAAVIERTVPGIAEAMRAAGLRSTPHAMLSRAIAGVRDGSLIINLPGSPGGAAESLAAVWEALSHAVAVIKRPVADDEHAPRRG